MNRVEISGGLVREPESGLAGAMDVCRFTVAVNGARWDRESGQQVVKTAYISCVAWGPVAIECLSLHQGDEVYLIGELDQYRKENKDESSTRVTVFAMSMLREGRRHATAQAGGDDPWR